MFSYQHMRSPRKKSPALSTQLFSRRRKAVSLAFFVSFVLCLERAKHQHSLLSLYFRKLAPTEIDGKIVLDITSVQKIPPKTYIILCRHITLETSPRIAIVFKERSSAYITKAASGCLTWVNFISFLALPGGQLKVILD